jgi:predicted deacetylase
VLAERGLGVTEDPFSVVRLADRKRFRAPAVQWSTRTRWRALAGVGIAAVRRPIDRPRRLLRLAIHPGDIETPMVARSLRSALDALLAQRQAISYREAMAAA